MSKKCENCGERTIGHTGLCRRCKSACHHAVKRIKAEGLIVDQMPGSGWWVWDAKGTVLVLGQSTKVQAVCAIELGDLSTTEEDEIEDAEMNS